MIDTVTPLNARKAPARALFCLKAQPRISTSLMASHWLQRLDPDLPLRKWRRCHVDECKERGRDRQTAEIVIESALRWT